MTASVVERILQSAEAQARTGGYNSFSFRGISNEIGIKSSSIHYYFPTKADLATALAKRYRERFAKHLDRIDGTEGNLQKKVDAYIDLFRQSLLVDKKMCLCGVFAAEIKYLPQQVVGETKQFFHQNLSWLKRLFKQDQMDGADVFAIQLLAALEGGMLLARTLDSVEFFNKATGFMQNGRLSEFPLQNKLICP